MPSLGIYLGLKCDNAGCNKSPNFPFPVCGIQSETYPKFVDLNEVEVKTIVESAGRFYLGLTGGEPSLYPELLHRFIDCVAERPQEYFRKMSILSNLNWAKLKDSEGFKKMNDVFEYAKKKGVNINLGGSIDNCHGNLDNIKTLLDNVKDAGGNIIHVNMLDDSNVSYHNKPPQSKDVKKIVLPSRIEKEIRCLGLQGGSYESVIKHKNLFDLVEYDGNEVLNDFSCLMLLHKMFKMGVTEKGGERYFSFYFGGCGIVGEPVKLEEIKVKELQNYTPEKKNQFMENIVKKAEENEIVQRLGKKGGIKKTWEERGKPPLIGFGKETTNCCICYQVHYGRAKSMY